ncbi:hypothetical protein AHAS_Ahas04G0156800 [Arachis hypogaea]
MSYQKMEIIMEEPKEVEPTMSRPLDTFLAKSPSQSQIEWVIISSFNFLGPYQYALLETDGQLRALCGLESKNGVDVGGQIESRRIKDGISNFESQRERKGIIFQKRKKTPNPTFASLLAYAQNPLNDIDKANQLLPAQDTVKFPNLYCELRFPSYNSKNLNTEKKLLIPSDLADIIHQRIDRMGLTFLDRELSRVNRSWVQEFYCNFFRHSLDSVFVRGIEVPITEQAIEDALTCRPKTSDTDAFMQAEIDLHCMTFDFEALRAVVATPDAPWVMDADNTAPKGMHFSYLSREAKTWQ